MSAPQRSWALLRYGLAAALTATVVSAILYPGGTVLDESTRGYSFTHNFLSDLGSTVAFNHSRNGAGALLFAGALLLGVGVFAGSFIGAFRLLSASPHGRTFARLAALAGALVCVGFLGAALAPLDRAFQIHIVSSRVGFYSFPVGTALLAVATWRDGRFGPRATLGWCTLTVVLVGFIVMAHLGPSSITERGLVTQVVTQKVMALTVLIVLWLESGEAERAAAR